MLKCLCCSCVFVCESDLSSHLKRFGNHSDDSMMSFHGEVEWLDSQKHSGADRVVR
jgi:hypothetical protein